MEPKPNGWSSEYGAWFREASVAERYDFRPPYPAEVFDILSRSSATGRATVLDAGCGTGDLARRLASLVDTVDAVDQSAAMLAQARALPGGDAANLTWIESPIETAALGPPYGLVVAGESVHWFDWERRFPRFAERARARRGARARLPRLDPGARAGERLGPDLQRYAAKTDFTRQRRRRGARRGGLFEQLGSGRRRPSRGGRRSTS